MRFGTQINHNEIFLWHMLQHLQELIFREEASAGHTQFVQTLAARIHTALDFFVVALCRAEICRKLHRIVPTILQNLNAGNRLGCKYGS